MRRRSPICASENPRAASVLRVEVITARPVSATVPSKSNSTTGRLPISNAPIGIPLPQLTISTPTLQTVDYSTIEPSNVERLYYTCRTLLSEGGAQASQRKVQLCLLPS